MDLTSVLLRVAARRPHVLVVPALGGTAARCAVEAAIARRGWPAAAGPADADIVVVAGSPGPELAAVIERVWQQVPTPRARVAVSDPVDLDRQLDAAVALLVDRDHQQARPSGAGEAGAGPDGAAADLGHHAHAEHREQATPDGHAAHDGRAEPGRHKRAGAGHGEAPASGAAVEHGHVGHAGGGQGDPHDHRALAGQQERRHGEESDEERQGGDASRTSFEHAGHGKQEGQPDDHTDADRSERHNRSEHESHSGDAGHADHEGDGTREGHEAHAGHHAHHGHGGGMELPGGLPMADLGEDRDGLTLDRLHVPLGPVLPDWPAGLVLGLTLQGDVIQEATAEVLDAAHAEGSGWRSGDVAARELDGLARFLGVAGWADAAAEARMLRDALLSDDRAGEIVAKAAALVRRVRRARTLRWSVRGIPAGTTDVAGLLEQRLDVVESALASGDARPAPRSTVEQLPGMLVGAEFAAARLVVAALDPDTEHVPAGEDARHG